MPCQRIYNGKMKFNNFYDFLESLQKHNLKNFLDFSDSFSYFSQKIYNSQRPGRESFLLFHPSTYAFLLSCKHISTEKIRSL